MGRMRNTIVGAMLTLLAATAAAAQQTTEKADALSDAARKGDAAAVRKLLDDGVDANTKFRYDRTALSFAADRGHVDVVRLLLDRGADVNAADTFYHATALTWAVSPAMDRKPEHAAVVRLLLQHGATGKDDALLSAVSDGNAEIAKVILEIGGVSAPTMSDALEAATRAKQPDVVTMLERAGAKPHVELKLDAAQLARYVGSYRSTGNMPQVTIASANGRLVATLGGQQPLTLVARDAATFGALEQPGAKVTFRVENGKAVAMTFSIMGNTMMFTRAEER
jgi:ankyrin repeat protein